MPHVSMRNYRARIPVAIVSGFLGSGKTTLINALLRDDRFKNTAVAVNEFGEIPIDQHLIDHGDDQTIVMANGCLCCNLAGDMEEAVMRVFARSEQGEIPKFDRLIIEPSGLSDPAPIAQALIRQPVLSNTFALHPLIVLVDAILIKGQLDRHPEVRKQIELADTIIMTKVDLVGSDAVEAAKSLLISVNPFAVIYQSRNGKIDPAKFLARSFYDAESISHPISDLTIACFDAVATVQVQSNEALHRHSHHAHKHEDITSVSLASIAPLDWRAIDLWLRKLRIENGSRLLRLKGLLNLKGSVRPVVIQAVEHVQSIPVELDGWSESDQRTRIVLIGRGLDANKITASWSALLNEAATPESQTS